MHLKCPPFTLVLYCDIWWPLRRLVVNIYCEMYSTNDQFCFVITGLHARWLVVIVNNGFPVDWSDSGLGHFDFKFYNKTPFLLWIVKNSGFLIIKYLWFVNFKYLFEKKIKLRKNSSFNWFTPFHVLIRPDVIWKKLSRPLYHVHFTVIHTNSRHNTRYLYSIVLKLRTRPHEASNNAADAYIMKL